MRHWFILFFCCTAFLAQAQPFPVGSRTLTFNDPARSGGFGSGGGPGRQIQCEIYYPATTAGANATVANGSFPVVVFGHGFVMTWDVYRPIYDSLARNGYVVVLPRTEGDIGPSHTDFAKDLALALDRTLALNTSAPSPFFGKLNGRGAIGGHSMGGGSTFLADAYTTQATCYFTFAAANTNPSAIAAAVTISRPHLLLAGEHDCVAPPADHQDDMYNALSGVCKVQVTINDAMHCQFNASNFNCNFGEQSLFCFQQSVDRDSQLRVTRKFLTPWLDYYLKGNCDAWTTFQQHLAAGFGVTVRQSCVMSVPTAASISGPVSFCTGTSASLAAAPAGFTYLWSNGTTASAASVQTGGNYTVTVSNPYCQRVSPPFVLQELSPPSPPTGIIGPDTLCSWISDWDFTLNAVSGATGYQWSLPGTLVNATADSAEIILGNPYSGLITVQAGNSCGYSVPYSMPITVLSPPAAQQIQAEPAVCLGSNVLLATVTPESGWQFSWALQGSGWQLVSGNGSPQVNVQPGISAGQLSVTAENAHCSLSLDTMLISILDTPQVSILNASGQLSANAAYPTYQWFFNGVAVSQNSSFSPTQSGLVQLQVTDANGCSGWSAPYTFSLLTAATETDAAGWHIYPNPATEQIIVESEQAAVVQITDRLGRHLLHSAIEAGQKKIISLQGFASGLYVVSLGQSLHRLLLIP